MTILHFAQISDIHLSTQDDKHDMMTGHAADFLSDVLAQLSSVEDLDFVLFTGDLFDAASQQEFDQFQQIIRTLHKPYHIVPGNHDRRSQNSDAGLTRRQFAQYFNPQVEARPAEPGAQAGYWSLTIRPDIQLIGLDSIQDKNWGGLIDAVQIEWLKNELAVHADKLVVLAVHHPLHPLAPIDHNPDWTNFVCDNGPEMLALLDKYPQVKIVLTGHHHLTRADVFGHRLHLACPALVGYPCAYRTLRLNRSAGDTWRAAWLTHPATDETITAQARQRLINAWLRHGFESNFVEKYACLAYGRETDRNGQAEFTGVRF